MAKGVKSITGNASPEVGEKNFYEVSSFYQGTVIKNENEIKWKLYTQQSSGNLRELRGPQKTGKKVPFSFPEKWLGKKLLIEAFVYNPEIKSPPGLIVTPKTAKIPRINKVELFYVDDKKGSVFSFMEKLRARAYCINMFLKELTFTLWEDDVKGGGHNTSNKPIDTLKARVDKNGVAVVEFPLSKAIMKKAMEGEVDVKQLEFYVTVEYYKNKKHTTENVDVNNPNPKTPIKTPKKTEPKQLPKAKGSPAESKSKSKKEEKGILDIIEEKWDELWDWWEIPGTIKKEQPPTVQKPEGRSPAVVKEQPVQTKDNKGKCIPCQIGLTVADLDKFMSDTPHGSIINIAPFNTRIPAYISYLNHYMTEFEINKNCYRRANFLGQVAKETKFWSYKEDFIYKSSVLKSKFSSFKSEKGRKYADSWGYDKHKSEITTERQIKIANWAYSTGTKASDLGNKVCPEHDLANPAQDGYKYRGRGLIQLTGRSNYTNFQSWYDENKSKYKLPDANFVSNPDLVFEPQYIVLSAIYFWTKNGLNEIADAGVGEGNVLKISNIINSGEEQVKKDIRYDYVRSAHSMLSDKARDCPFETKYEAPSGKWHDPVDNPICTLYMQSGGGGEAGKHWGLFGQTRNGSDHVGLDLFATKGTNIYACVDGTIYNRRWHGGYGNTITIKVKNPQEFLKFKRNYSLQYASKGEINKGSGWSEEGDIYLFYGHLDSVKDYTFGQEVTCGEVLGTTGRSGVVKGTCAPHLHFEVLSDYVMGSGSIRTRINPAFFVDYKGYNEQSAGEKKKQEDEKNNGKIVQHDGVKKLPYADIDGFIK